MCIRTVMLKMTDVALSLQFSNDKTPVSSSHNIGFIITDNCAIILDFSFKILFFIDYMNYYKRLLILEYLSINNSIIIP